jgi:protein-tyrosine phosphatase
MSAGQTIAPERRHLVDGVYNLRDTGGYRAGSGTSRWGKLFRSDALHRLDDAGRALLAELGIAHVVDLRSSDETLTARSLIDGMDAVVHHIPVFAEAAPGAQVVGEIGLAPLYDHMADERGAQLAAAVRVIANADRDEAVLVHCMAGKDRTGLVIAFSLRAVGVDLDEVVADYAQTSDNLRGEWADAMVRAVTTRGVEITPDVIDLVTASPAPIMAALIERIENEYGSMGGYLRAQGLTQDELDRLTAALID